MNANDYLKINGVKRSRDLAAKAGTSYAYFWQIATGRRRPSPDLAEKLVEASNHELDFVSLLRGKAK